MYIGGNMDFHYELGDEMLKKLVEKKAIEMNMSVDQLIWGYINRGLMEDDMGEDIFEKLHSKKFLNEVNEVLGLD